MGRDTANFSSYETQKNAHSTFATHYNNLTLPNVTVTALGTISVGILKFLACKKSTKSHPQHLCHTLQYQKTTPTLPNQKSPSLSKKETANHIFIRRQWKSLNWKMQKNDNFFLGQISVTVISVTVDKSPSVQ